MLRLEGVSCKLSESYSLRSADMAIRQGECIGLFGPNGCGKSTLLLLMAGVVPPNAGRILLHDKPLGKSLPRNFEQGVVLFPQANAKTHHLSLRKVSALVDHQMSARRQMEAVSGDDALKLTASGMNPDLPLDLLSYGECRAGTLQIWLDLKPKLLLLDEPFAGLNEKLLSNLVEKIQISVANCVSFVVDHDIERLRILCSSIWRFERGEILPETLRK